MRTQWVRCLIRPALLLALASGCQSMFQYRPMDVQVVDAETKKPISGAEVQVSYPVTPRSQAPRNSSGITGKDGDAVVQAAARGEDCVQVTATAKGYVSEEKDLTAAVVRASGSGGKSPARCVVEMYADPRPNLVLVLPTGYRGQVKVGVQPRADIPCAPGQREFSYEVAANGTVEIAAPPVLHKLRPEAYNARYADGTPLTGALTDANGEPLPRYKIDNVLGLWWLKRDEHYEYFLVGTIAEFNVLSRSPATGGVGVVSPPQGKGHNRGWTLGSPQGNQPTNKPPATPGQQAFNPGAIY